VAFLFFFVSASAAGAACRGNVAEDGSGGTGGSGQGGGDAGVTCVDPDGSPSACLSNPCDPFPNGSTPCSTEGVTCLYQGADEDVIDVAVCYQGTWVSLSCFNNLMCVCPAMLPIAGSTCDPCWSQPCPYLDDAGVGPTAQCAPDGTWSVSGSG
jgi:hypothetical protein